MLLYRDFGQDTVVLCLDVHLRFIRLDLKKNVASGERLSYSMSDMFCIAYTCSQAIDRCAPGYPLRTFFDLPAGDVAFGHGGGESGHLKVLRSSTRGRGAEAWQSEISGCQQRWDGGS